MRTYLVVIIATALIGAVCADCDACLDGNCYRKHSLPEDTGGYEAINRNTNTFYSASQIADQKFITLCNLTTLICNDTPNLWNIIDFTVDQRTGDVYAALPGRQSIYNVDLVKSERVLLVDEAVSYITFKDKLYYAPLNDVGIFTFEDGTSRIVPGTEGYHVGDFIVDKKDDIYFEDNNSNFIRKLKKGAVNSTEFCVGGHQLSVDKDANAMFLDQRSNAFYRVTNDQLVEVGAVTDEVHSPLFDGDNNIIFSYPILLGQFNSIWGRYYLKQVTDVQCSTKEGVYQRVITETIRTTTPKPIEPTTMFTYTTPAQETSSSPDDSDTSGSSQQQTNQERHRDHSCTCSTPKLPTVTVKIEFN